MKRWLKYSVSSIVVLLFVMNICSAQGKVPVITSIVHESNGSITITWTIDSEEGIAKYEIFRTSGSSQIKVGECNKGVLFLNDPLDLLKNAGPFLKYVVEAVYVNGSRFPSNAAGTSYTSSTARRTWGSIKAMFR
jgi:hypothetical protein